MRFEQLLSFSTYIGLQICESPLLLDTEIVTTDRPLSERLLSFKPSWRPFTKTKKVTRLIPSPRVYRVNNKIYLHPMYARKLKEHIYLQNQQK